jgi:hypothetical protein
MPDVTADCGFEPVSAETQPVSERLPDPKFRILKIHWRLAAGFRGLRREASKILRQRPGSWPLIISLAKTPNHIAEQEARDDELAEGSSGREFGQAVRAIHDERIVSSVDAYMAVRTSFSHIGGPLPGTRL